MGIFQRYIKKTLGATPLLAKTENRSEKVLGLFNIRSQEILKPVK